MKLFFNKNCLTVLSINCIIKQLKIGNKMATTNFIEIKEDQEQVLMKKEDLLNIENQITKEKRSKSIFFALFASVTAIALIGCLFNMDRKPPLSVSKLESVNKVLIFDTILFENNDLYKLQNNIYKDLKANKQNVNYLISNPELLVMNLNTNEFAGSQLRIGTDATIEININKDKKMISYTNFTKEGREVILKQIDKNNYPKINIKTVQSKNEDETYNIFLVIDRENLQEIENINMYK